MSTDVMHFSFVALIDPDMNSGEFLEDRYVADYEIPFDEHGEIRDEVIVEHAMPYLEAMHNDRDMGHLPAYLHALSVREWDHERGMDLGEMFQILSNGTVHRPGLRSGRRS